MSYTGEEPKFLTQPPADNSTKVATTGYVDAAIAAAASGWLSSVESANFNAVVSTIHVLSAAVNATLPDPALGGQIILKDDSGNGFTITPFASELIEGVAGLFTVAPTRASFMLASDGTNWHITSSYIGTTPIFNTMTVNDHIILGQAVNAATGSNAAVTLATVSPVVELNDPGLVSIDTITGVDQATLFLFNNTGANITLNDQTGSPAYEQIMTGEGANVVLKQGYVAHLIYLGGFWVLLNIKKGTVALSEISQSGATTGQVPAWSGSAWVPTTPSGGGSAGRLLRTTYFTASGTWTKLGDVGSIFVEVTGGGGNGGNIVSGVLAAGHGGGGGYSEKTILAAALAATVTVTVGGAGGTSTFTGHCSAAGGGAGGNAAGAAGGGGFGGSGSSGDLNLTGTSGDSGFTGSSSGGSSPKMNGEGVNTLGTVAGMQAGKTNSGGGGNGRMTSPGSGSAGGSGLVIVREYSA